MNTLFALWISVSTLWAPAAPAQEAPPQDALERRATQIAALIDPEPSWSDDLFDPAFLEKVPREKLRAIGQQLHASFGPATEQMLTTRKGPFAGTFDFVLEKDTVVPISLTLSEQAPHAVLGLWFGSPAPRMKDLSEVVQKLKELPGRVSFAVWKLGGEKPEVLAELEPEEPLAIGSAFKLYVLGTLVRQIADGKRKSTDIVLLEQRDRSLPSGELQRWPLGSPVTLHTLASLMVAHSDNTATDHLLRAVGREVVEAGLEPMGHRHAARTLPLLATHEMFKLKFTRGAKGAEKFLELDLPGRRAFLDQELAGWPLDESVREVSLTISVNRIGEIEWFASAADLCRAMDWLRRNTESGPAAHLRDVLSISRGLSISTEHFPWVGFKGGSEPGVLNLTCLLKAKDGSWFALSASWNDAQQALDETRLVTLVQRATHLIGSH